MSNKPHSNSADNSQDTSKKVKTFNTIPKKEPNLVRLKVTGSFTQIPNQLIDASNIKPAARLLWIYYSSNSGEFNPSNEVAAQSLGLGKNTVKRAKKELLEHNMISIEKTVYKGGGGHKDIVTLNTVGEWSGIEYTNKRSSQGSSAHGQEVRRAQNEPYVGPKMDPTVGPKMGPYKRKENIKENSSSEAATRGAENAGKPQRGATKKKTTTTKLKQFGGGKKDPPPKKLPLTTFYSLINKITGHASPSEKNAVFQSELDRLGVDDFSYVTSVMECDGLKVVWSDPSERTELNYKQISQLSDFLLKERE